MDLYGMFVLMATATVLSPGPGVLMTLTNALHLRRRDTFGGVLGIAVGAAVVAALSATSLGIVLAASPAAYTVLKWMGAAYLIYLGLRLWRAQGIAVAEGGMKPGTAVHRFAEGVTLQLTNPKAIFFFLSVFPQFIRPDAHFARQFAVLVVTYGTIVVLVHCLYAACAQYAKRWLASRTGGTLLQRVAGTVFIAFAALLAFH
ncbi:LysE family translocator [Pseudoduganella ginsengisoli]|uniref:LysE family translocator n=1 Tax=Pseudoduganella ginsengisoli TaxID=1462440 RepID=A0A6L6Q2Y2_9BURK|nr:LysE family translocator [Pseudoduganella ginsengisoli]MTW04197.1 LysE family translocator [Pseudoduganella ginsengisoli]